MTSSDFHDLLARADVEELARVIDWLQRAWEPRRNDALRAAWHALRRQRHGAARSVLVAALETEIAGLSPADLEHVARRLGAGGTTTVVEVWDLIARRLAPLGAEPASVAAPARGPALSSMEATLLAIAGTASRLIELALLGAQRRSRHHGRRHERHG